MAWGSWRSCTWFERLRGCEGPQHADCARRLDGFAACAACQRAALLSHALPSCSWLFLALFIISQPPCSPTLEIKMNSLQSAAGTSPHPCVPAVVLSWGNRAGRGRLSHPQLSGVRGGCREGFLLALRQQRMRWGASWHRTGRLLAAQPSCQPSVGSIYGASGWGLALTSPPGTGTLCRPRSPAGTPQCTTRWWTFPKNTWKGRTPARKGDVLCRGWFGSGATVLDVASWPCQGTGGRSLYRGSSRQKPAVFYETLFLLWHFILQIGCSWGLCVAMAAAA